MTAPTSNVLTATPSTQCTNMRMVDNARFYGSTPHDSPRDGYRSNCSVDGEAYACSRAYQDDTPTFDARPSYIRTSDANHDNARSDDDSRFDGDRHSNDDSHSRDDFCSDIYSHADDDWFLCVCQRKAIDAPLDVPTIDLIGDRTFLLTNPQAGQMPARCRGALRVLRQPKAAK